MKVKAIKTKKIIVGDDLYQILDQYLPKLEENTVIAVSSKIISICQGDAVKNDGKVDKKKLIIKEADLYIDQESDYGIVLPTIKNNVFLANSGVDESNANGYYILWPKNLDETTCKIWDYLRKKNKIKKLGVVVTDSRLTPLMFGITGVAISWCGFEAAQDYRGKPDIFGRELRMSQKSITNGLAGAAEVVMGEGSEQTPLGIITDVPNMVFQNRPPTKEERESQRIELKNDIFGKFLTSVKWLKGGAGIDKKK
ncbi:MAG: coenzyme F420-0:L-glutamate ligase [Candidatus Levybacteria bacterium]|nr:coenzyme F420-0:L-glutamate ligase [Candidatus Levybacteria bacterium]